MKQNNRQENRQLFSNFINLLVLPVPELSRSHTLSCWCCQVLATLQAPRPQTNRCFLCSAVECSVFTCVFIVFHVFHNALPGNLVWRSELPWLLETCVTPKVTCTCSRWPPYMFSSMSRAHIHIIHIDTHHAEWIDKCICKQSRATSPTISQETGGFCHQILLWTCTSAECKTNRKKLTKGYQFNGFLERCPLMSYLNMPLQIVNSPTQHMYDRKIRDARTWNEMLWLYS